MRSTKALPLAALALVAALTACERKSAPPPKPPAERPSPLRPPRRPRRWPAP
jgi:predicted small lipoprotein YifL